MRIALRQRRTATNRHGVCPIEHGDYDRVTSPWDEKNTHGTQVLALAI